MTTCDSDSVNKPAQHSRGRLAAVNVVFLLVAIAACGQASAAVDCNSKPLHHAAATTCRAHGLHAVAPLHGNAARAPVEGDELTPISWSAAPPRDLLAQTRSREATSTGARLPAQSSPLSLHGALTRAIHTLGASA